MIGVVKVDGRCRFKASEFERERLEHFVEVVAALGVKINLEISESGRTARVTVEDLPSSYDAKVRRTRNAGRRSKGIALPESSIFNYDTTCAEFLEWQKSHTVEDGMRELGLSRSTYFRRLKAIREKVAWEREHNPHRARSGMDELHHTLGGVR